MDIHNEIRESIKQCNYYTTTVKEYLLESFYKEKLMAFEDFRNREELTGHRATISNMKKQVCVLEDSYCRVGEFLLPNVHISFIYSGKNKVIDSIKFAGCRWNILGAQKLGYILHFINENISDWRNEFFDLLYTYSDEIQDAQLEKDLKFYFEENKTHTSYISRELYLLSDLWKSISPILAYKPQLSKTLQQKNGSFVIELQNCTVKSWGETYSRIEIPGMHDFFVCQFLVSDDSLQYLDSNILRWIEQGKDYDREFAKQKKIQEIGTSGLELLVKNKMKELHTKYDLQKGKNGSFTVMVKADAKRYVKVNLSVKDLQKVQEQLNTIPMALEFMKQAPSYLHFGIYGNNVKWKMEE